ncbi:MAG: hypothetical protein U0M13_10690 [Desulfovibrio fairfieldensis]|nr:hypothetical protein [Desulfovibrio fairfieldensis]
MIKIDLSIEALLARRELAEKATPGPWEKDGDDIYTEWSREEYPEREVPTLCAYHILRRDILALFLRRGEYEVLCLDKKKARQVERIKIE